MITNKELNILKKQCKNKNDVKKLIIEGINEDIKMTDKQLLSLIKLKEEMAY